MEKLWNYISKFLCRSTTEVRRETDFDGHQSILDFLNEPSPKARGEHKKEVILSDGSVIRTSFTPEKTKAAATETSKKGDLAAGSQKAGTSAEKKRKGPTFGEKFFYSIGPLLLRANGKFWTNLSNRNFWANWTNRNFVFKLIRSI